MLAVGACLLVVENAIPGILGIGHVLAPPNVLHCPNFPPASPAAAAAAALPTALLCSKTAHWCKVRPRRASTQLSSTAFPPPIPSPPTSVSFARPCCTAEHRAGILIKGYTPSFSPSLHTPTPLPNRKPDSAVLSGR